MKTHSVVVLGLSVIAACAAARNGDPGGQGGDATIASASASGSSDGGSGGVQGSGSGHSSASIVGVGTGAGGGENPGSCLVTCTNHAPNHEPGCDPCMISACSLEYTACAADKGDGGPCITCADLLAQGGNGIDCDSAAELMTALLNCVCNKGTCD